MSNLLIATERKESAKNTRKQGNVPGTVYGPGIGNNLNIQLKGKEIIRFLNKHSIGAKTKLKVNKNNFSCVIKNIQYETLTHKPLHIDFYATSEDGLVKVSVPLRFKGNEQLFRSRLVLNIHKDEVEIQGKLKDLPGFIDVDVSAMKDGSEISLGDIPLPEGIKLLDKKKETVATVTVAEGKAPEDEDVDTETVGEAPHLDNHEL